MEATVQLSNYCVLPFNSISISAMGEVRQCCNAGYIPSTVNIEDLQVPKIINNELIHDIRDAFIKDQKHEKCSRCWKMEELGSKSFRQVANDDKEHGIRNGIKNIKKQIEFEDIEYIDITLGNKCNLACRMCNWSSSSLLAKQLIELGRHTGPSDIDFSQESKNKILEVFKQSKNLNSIYMLGGEPLINPFHDEILDLLIKTGQSNKISIHYNTNLQVNKMEDYLEKWKHFKTIHLQASIDGSDEVYEYIRWPGKWNKLYNNLLTLVEKGDGEKIKVSISTTIQNINAANIPQLIEKCQSLKEKAVSFFFIPVVGKSTLDLTPKKVLSNAIKELESMPIRNQIPMHDLLANYYAALKMDIDKQSVIDFFEEQKMFDIKRNQNLFDTIPYFVDLANNYNIERW